MLPVWRKSVMVLTDARRCWLRGAALHRPWRNARLREIVIGERPRGEVIDPRTAAVALTGSATEGVGRFSLC